MLRTRGGRRHARPAPIAVADSPRFEARPSLAVDPQGRVWVAYEERTDELGQGRREPAVDGEGSTLYRASAVRVRCVDGGRAPRRPRPGRRRARGRSGR